MIKIACIDDEKNFRDAIADFSARYAKENALVKFNDMQR